MARYLERAIADRFECERDLLGAAFNSKHEAWRIIIIRQWLRARRRIAFWLFVRTITLGIV